jgi:hypothetical protein
VVLIEVRNSRGVVGRCDANCYQAKGDTCTCICGGVNHGVGQQQAIKNTLEIAAEWEKVAPDREWELCTFHILSPDEPVQLETPF